MTRGTTATTRRARTAGSPMGDAGPLSLTDLDRIGIDLLGGVGPKRVQAMQAMGIASVLDLLVHFPRRYLDRTRQSSISDMAVGEEGMVIATVGSISSRRVRGGRAMVTAEVRDGSGRMRLTFFNQAWRERQLAPGTDAVFFGKLELFRGVRQMTNPVVDLIGNRTGRIIPVYPQSEKSGVSSWEIGDLVAQALRRCTPRGLSDPVPERVRAELGLIDREAALRGIHLPESMAEVSAARDRLVFDELLRVQLALVARKRELERSSLGLVHLTGADAPVPGLVDRFLASLPFPLTAAQERVISEIRLDLRAAAPMHRLLQGDVGAGKTVVAACALLSAVENQRQGAFMAPTEVLADQHAAALTDLLGGFVVGDADSLFGERPLAVASLTNKTPAPQRRRVLADLAEGRIDLLIGTHALIQDAVGFHRLGVAVIDEQHRFGVEQRAALRAANADGTVPDVLVMTATPIPRTAAMTVYGDLDVSVIDELPPGRTPIATVWSDDLDVPGGPWAKVREEVERGRQAYVVCPLVEESEKLEIASATEMLQRLEHTELAGLRLGLLHGRLTGADKEGRMERFRRGELDVLVATTVIEVGVDVANATVMVICDADRFGIAQLHQLRGRVGRGRDASWCFLLAGEVTPDAEARLAAMVRSTDGFELAEVDLDLRGEGTIMGERQKGRNDLRLASLRRDRAWVERARAVAFDLIDGEGGLAGYAELAADVRVMLGEEETEFLMKG